MLESLLFNFATPHPTNLAKTRTFSRPPARPTAFWTPPRTRTKYFSMVALLIWIFQKNQSQWFGKIIRFFLSVCNIFWLPLINQSHILHASFIIQTNNCYFFHIQLMDGMYKTLQKYWGYIYFLCLCCIILCAFLNILTDNAD